MTNLSKCWLEKKTGKKVFVDPQCLLTRACNLHMESHGVQSRKPLCAHGETHTAKIKINQNYKTQPQIFDIWCKNVRWKCRNFKEKFLPMSFFAKWGKVKWRPLKQTKSKNKHHFSSPTFWVIQLCFWVQKDSSTLKTLKICFFPAWELIQNIAY